MTQNNYISPQILECMHFSYTTRPGEPLFFRTVQYYEIDINLTGERTMWLDGKRYDVTPGSVICRLPGQRAGSLGNYNMYLLTLDFHPHAEAGRSGRPLTHSEPASLPEANDSYYWQTLPTIFQPAHTAELLKLYERLSLIWRLPDKKEETDDLLAALLHLLLSDAFRNRLSRESHDSPVSSVVAYLQTHYAEKITLDDLAKAAALNKSYLVRLFKKSMGTTPIEYLSSLRLSAAKNMLANTDAPIKRIADQCGYEDPSYFIARFRLAFGQTPDAYRKCCRKEIPIE